MRRSWCLLSYSQFVPDGMQDRSVSDSMFGWSYLFPQHMVMPHTVNRTKSMPYRSREFSNSFKSVWIPLDMHPVYRAALEPYLRKLALTRAVPPTKPAEAVADWKAKAPLIDDAPTRHAWLAKVLHLCGIHKAADDGLALWAEECHADYVTGDAVPTVGLGTAVVYCAAAGRAAEWRQFYECCLQRKWNITPHFETPMWNELLECAAAKADGEAVVLLLDEMVDVQFTLEWLDASALVRALNAVTETAHYERIKKILFAFTPEKTEQVIKRYTSLRSRAELEVEGAEMPENDVMFYHVHWHNRIRHPLTFNPRQQFFDYKPSAAVDTQTKLSKKTAAQLVEERMERWKAEGLVPEDYEHKQHIDDVSERHKEAMRTEFWKRKPTWTEKWKGGIVNPLQ